MKTLQLNENERNRYRDSDFVDLDQGFDCLISPTVAVGALVSGFL